MFTFILLAAISVKTVCKPGLKYGEVCTFYLYVWKKTCA